MQQMQPNPPYIKFETRAIERRKPDTEGGGVYYVDVDFAIVTAHGGKDSVEKICSEWFVYLKEQARQGRFPQPWLDAFKAAFAAWKSDQEIPVIGTAIKNWPVASAAEIKRLSLLGIRAVEDLATANEDLIGKLGMGGRSLCARAKDWVVAKEGIGPLVSQVDALRQSQAGMEARVEELIAANKALTAQLAMRESQVAASIRSGEPLRDLDDRLHDARAAAALATDEDDLITDAIEN